MTKTRTGRHAGLQWQPPATRRSTTECADALKYLDYAPLLFISERMAQNTIGLQEVELVSVRDASAFHHRPMNSFWKGGLPKSSVPMNKRSGSTT